MVNTIKTVFPTESDIQWFVKNVGPRTHWLPGSIGGRGWKFQRIDGVHWNLTVDDEKYLSFYLLTR